jgi:hypothetical protein
MVWIDFPNDILVELSTKYYASQSSPNMTFANLPIEYALDLKIVACCLAIHRGEFVVPDSLQIKNNYRATHQHIFFALVTSYSFANPYNDGITSYKCPIAPQSHMPMYTTSSLFVGKCNIM